MGTSEPRDRQPDRLLLLELAGLVALTVADAYGYVPISRTPFLLLLCWASLRLRGLRWSAIGFSWPDERLRAIGIGVAAGLALELFATYVTTPWIARLTKTPLDMSELADLVGNPTLLLVYMVLNWTLAAFGEELAFRGYLLTRFADAFRRSPASWIVGLVLVSLYFGVGHGYQGLSGIVQESLSGLWLGLLFLATGRNLTVPIVAHGVSNSLALMLIYVGRYPGLP